MLMTECIYILENNLNAFWLAFSFYAEEMLLSFLSNVVIVCFFTKGAYIARSCCFGYVCVFIVVSLLFFFHAFLANSLFNSKLLCLLKVHHLCFSFTLLLLHTFCFAAYLYV